MRHEHLDKVGATLSVICAIHCVLTPIILIALPLVGLGLLADEKWEIAFLILSGALATGSNCWGYAKHKNFGPIGILSIAIALLIAGHMMDKHIIAGFGGICVAFSHWFNYKLCHSCKKCL